MIFKPLGLILLSGGDIGFSLAHCFIAFSFRTCDEDEVVDVGQVMDSPPGECIGQGLGDPEPLVHTRPAAKAHAGVYVVFACPLDPLQLPVFGAHWLGFIRCFDVGFCHPTLTRPGVAFFDAVVDILEACHLEVVSLRDAVVDRIAQGHVPHRDWPVLCGLGLDAPRRHSESFERRFVPRPDDVAVGELLVEFALGGIRVPLG